MPPYFLRKFHATMIKGRRNISEAVEYYSTTGQIEKLVDFCNCCLYTMFDERLLVSECSTCRIHHLKKKIVKGCPPGENPYDRAGHAMADIS